jgi:extracellular factor (EF) 3-hydroxypalmitic acid methyl ester biosynthesis protein
VHNALEPRVDHIDDINDPNVAVLLLSESCRQLESLARFSVAGSPRTYHRAVSIVHDICHALTHCEAAGVPDAEIRRLIEPARAIHAQSPFVTRLQQWPRGYPGDFETIEWLVRGENRAAPGTLAHALETYALTAAIAQQHRNKVNFQSACMLETFATARPCRILSIGCGGNPDLRAVIDQVPPSATLVLCDSDHDALAYSRDKLQPIADRCHFVHGFVPRVLRRVREHGPFDLILAGGLFDYLTDRFITRTLSEAWETMLAPGGRFVFTNIATGNPYRVWIEYLGDWKLIERSETDIAALCDAAGVPAPPQMVRDATSLAIVATVRKECRGAGSVRAEP